MKNNRILLSICIPTYNRCVKLSNALAAWKQAIEFYGGNDVELIVSDNCSSDDTASVLSQFEMIPNFRHYRNSDNLGFNRNMFHLVDEYAKGEFCWIIGDDDFVDTNCLITLLDVLKDNVDYVSLNFRKYSDLNKYNRSRNIHNNKSIFRNVTFYESIDKNASLNNILATLMTTSVFRREPFVKCKRDGIMADSRANYMSTFPNSFLMLKLFHDSICGCIKSPIFSIIDEKKEWSENGDLYFKNHLFQLYSFYCSVLGDKVMEESNNGKWMRRLKAKYIVRDELLKGHINFKTIIAFKDLLLCPSLYIHALLR